MRNFQTSKSSCIHICYIYIHMTATSLKLLAGGMATTGFGGVLPDLVQISQLLYTLTIIIPNTSTDHCIMCEQSFPIQFLRNLPWITNIFVRICGGFLSLLIHDLTCSFFLKTRIFLLFHPHCTTMPLSAIYTHHAFECSIYTHQLFSHKFCPAFALHFHILQQNQLKVHPLNEIFTLKL